MSDLGLNFTQKWNTDNTLTTEVTMEDQVGSRNRRRCSLDPDESLRSMFHIQNVRFSRPSPVSLCSWRRA